MSDFAEEIAQLVERLNGQGQVLDEHEARIKSLEANVRSHEQQLNTPVPFPSRTVGVPIRILEVPGGSRAVADDPWCTCTKRGECIGCRIEKLVDDYIGQIGVNFLDRHRTRWNPGAR